MRIVGTGVDIIEVKRLKDAVQKWGDEFLNRIFTQRELKSAQKRISLYQHLAGRFAAKEAVFKALGLESLNWKDVQIVNDDSGKPHCEILNAKVSGCQVHVSIPHVKNYAVAHAVIEKKT